MAGQKLGYPLLIAVLGLGLTACPTPPTDPPPPPPPEETGTTETAETGDTGEAPPQLPPAPALRSTVDMSDSELALEALILMGQTSLGAKNETCSECHSLNQGVLGSWLEMTKQAEQSCFSEPNVTTVEDAQAIIDCMREMPDVEGSAFSTPKLGLYSAAVSLDWFDFVFDAVNEDTTEYDKFVSRVAMPRPERTPWTQAEFDIVAEWFARDLPFIEDLLPGAPPPGGCVPDISPEVGQHIDAMATTGWRAENENDGLLMFGCEGATTATDCLSTYPAANTTTYGATWEYMPDTTVRVLRTNNYRSSFWTRSSADGRFVAHGGGSGGNNSTIVDLATDTEIGANAFYDPAFSPDNEAFMFQGFQTSTCTQDLLTSGVTQVNFNEPECDNSTEIGLYQHIGATLGGGDYWAVNGRFVSDDGSSGANGNPAAYFGPSDNVTLTPFVYDGSSFVEKPANVLPSPFEGDAIISRSSQLLVSRVAGTNGQNGLRMRKIEATPNGAGYDVDIPAIATYCINGGKPDVSFDERWLVIHSYISDSDEDAIELGFTGADDPGFAQYASSGTANLFLVDLRSGLTRRITHMEPGQFALFPHFRSDGWIYFMVRAGSSLEYIAASDAALIAEE